MSFLSKLSKPKYKGKVGHVPMFDENGELIDSGAEAGGGGELTPEALSEVLEGSDSVVVDLNEEGNKLQVSVDSEVITKSCYINLIRLSTNSTGSTSFNVNNVVLSLPYALYEALNPTHSKTTAVYQDEFLDAVQSVYPGTSLKERFLVNSALVVYNENIQIIQECRYIGDKKLSFRSSNLATGATGSTLYLLRESTSKINLEWY